MEMEALMPRQPGADFGMLVGGVIVNIRCTSCSAGVWRLIVLRKRMNS